MTAAVAPVAAERGVRVSPVAATMVALSAGGLWNLWDNNGTITLGLGAPAIAAWAAWAVYGLVAVGVVLWLQRFARRPAVGVLLALAWGGLAATWAAQSANTALSDILRRTTGSDPHSWLAAPLVEESIKALGVVGLALIPVVRRFRPLDGLFYGVLIGAGFQVVEDALYTASNLLHTSSSPDVVIIGTLLTRGIAVGLFTHAVYTGLVGAAIGWAASAPVGMRTRRSLVAVAAFVGVAASHSLFNMQQGVTALSYVASLVPFVVLLVVLARVRKAEAAALATAAAASGGWGVLDVDGRNLLAAERPSTSESRRRQHDVRAYAWAAEQIGPESPQARKAAAALKPASG